MLKIKPAVVHCSFCDETSKGLMVEPVDAIAIDPNNNNEALCESIVAVNICCMCVGELFDASSRA